MTRQRPKLDIRDVAGLEIIERDEKDIKNLFNMAKEKISDIKKDADEVADSLNAIKLRLKEHKLQMERLNQLGTNIL
jgi:hypothetical protein